MKKLKVLIIVLIFFTIGLLVIINARTPFVTPERSSWSIGYGFFKSIDSFHITDKKIYSKEELKTQNDSTSFLADPFFVKKDSIFYMFFEHQKTKSGADVGLMSSLDGESYEYAGTVLNEKFHLSYPQVFKHKDEYFMIPESQAANQVLLYQSFDFPKDWRIVDTLLYNTRLKDPTVYISDTLTILVGSDHNMTMFMYQADSLRGDWKPHQRDLVMQGTEARPGGRFLNLNGKLILPVQNSTHGYGYGLSLYEFNFKGGAYTFRRRNPFYLKANSSIKEFNAGMHHLDLQFVGNKMYAVYDGHTLKADGENKMNLRGPLKWNFLDLMNWIRN